jgi:uncharacterized MAPEG superfamily protein
MKPEVFWLTATILMTALFWVPYVLNRIAVCGLSGALSGNVPDMTAVPAWAQRAARAHQNAIENLVLFAALVLLAQAQGVASTLLAAVTQVYFFTRLIHYIVYAAGLPGLRTLTFAVGWACQIVLIVAILKLM